MERVIKKGEGVKDKACESTECIIQCKHIPDAISICVVCL